MLSEQDHRPVLLGRTNAATERSNSDLGEVFFADALSRFKASSDMERSIYQHGPDVVSPRATHEQPAPKQRRPQLNQYARPLPDKDELLHHQLLRGVHKVWNQRPADGTLTNEYSLKGSRRNLTRPPHNGTLTVELNAPKPFPLVEPRLIRSQPVSPRSVRWHEQNTDTPLIDDATPRAATLSVGLEALGPPDKLHPNAAARRRRATELAAANQRRRVELRAAKEAIVRELLAEQKRSNVLQVNLETKISDLVSEHQIEMEVMHAALADAEVQVGLTIEPALPD